MISRKRKTKQLLVHFLIYTRQQVYNYVNKLSASQLIIQYFLSPHAQGPMAELKPVTTAHLVAVPFPGRGHINPMINFCKLLAIKRPDIDITLVVTEEWHGFLISDEMPNNIIFGTIPNVLPSELVRAADFSGFVQATLTKMEEPVEGLIGQLDLRPRLIIYDMFLMWIPGVGNRMNIPVASFWPMSATVFSMYQHRHLLVQNGHFPVTNLSG